MSIIIQGLSFGYPSEPHLFRSLNFALPDREKAALIGNNGLGKSSFLKIIAGILQPNEGSIFTASTPYYLPQHSGLLQQTVAQALRISRKWAALEAINRGSTLPEDWEALGEDWDLPTRYEAALAFWQLPKLDPQSPVDPLSGGEKTKLLLAGLSLHQPQIILLDEPSNHLDRQARELLYNYVAQCKSSLLVVSHDRELLRQLSLTYELSDLGLKRYGGNYDFYLAQKELEEKALDGQISAEEKALRLARDKAREARERQEKRLVKGQKQKGQVPRIFKKTLSNSSENTAARLKGQHDEGIRQHQESLSTLRQQKSRLQDIKIDFDNSGLHAGKLLAEASELNFAYPSQPPLWKEPLHFKLFSRDRLLISGHNGSGKTSLLKLLTGQLSPSQGLLQRADFSYIYLDQHYSQVFVDDSVLELAQAYNHRHLEEHEIKLRLHRFLFPADSWNKSCKNLSGGERMRLYLCCLMISNHTPDLIMLDEPTNNLDISSLQVLTQTLQQYQGCLLVISHDGYFVEALGVNKSLQLT